MRNSVAKRLATRKHTEALSYSREKTTLEFDATSAPRVAIPSDARDFTLQVDGREVHLTNLQKIFWPDEGIRKRDLLQYYADIASVLLPHIESRAMVMKRYPNGAFGEFFFQKRAPSPRPDWIPICSIEHRSKNVVDFPVINDLPSLLWVVNLGCIDLNPWYARCDDVYRPDYLHFDLDPTPGATFAQVRKASLKVRDGLAGLGVESYPKTTGSRGIHIYVPIQRGPLQKEVWTFAKAFARRLAAQFPNLITAEYRIAKRPEKHVLVDYNQNAWGRTLACAYSARPKPKATVSAPVTWEEIESGADLDDFTLKNMPERVRKLGDLFYPLIAESKRLDFRSIANAKL